MEDTSSRAVAIVGVGAVLPDAPNAQAFWENMRSGRYSITDVSPERWDPALYYDPDPKAPDKTYSKIGGWCREFEWNPLKWKLGGIPPRVSDAMDEAQKWAIACTHEALADFGVPDRPLDRDRTAVILGNAMAGEKHYATALRINLPDVERELRGTPTFHGLPDPTRAAVIRELESSVARRFPEITEDTMPGELANCIAGRIANLFNFHGPNFVCDAACASAIAAISAAIEGLVAGDFDAVVTGGVDRNMGASTYVKFCKIGALSATGARPYAEGADGFVMGEGAVVFLLKRLADAERAGDPVYAVLRGIGGASDGKGKGITAPNPVGQRLAVERAWKKAGLDPASCTLVEGHGTSTRVGDVVEVESLIAAFGNGASGLKPHSIPLGSVKSNIGHLKGAAGAAGLLKAALALRYRQIPPSLNFRAPNPSIDFAHAPFHVNTELREWPAPPSGVRRAGVSAFGFGGTNFHTVLEEFVPGRLKGNGRSRVALHQPADGTEAGTARSLKAPLRGALVVGADSADALGARLAQVAKEAAGGRAPLPVPPLESDLRAAVRVAIDYQTAADLAEKASRAHKALDTGSPAVWKALQAQGIFRGQGPAPGVAFLYTGQGSQYVNMLRVLRDQEPIVRATFAEADGVMTPILGRPLSDHIFVDAADEASVARAEEGLKQTAITQPAVLAVDAALTRLLAAYGIEPDLVMGHSLGEYGALVSAGALPFAQALEAVAARGREMTRVSVEDNGKMAAVFAPLAEVERVLATIDGYVVVANHNSRSQAVIGGDSPAVEAAVQAFTAAGFNAVTLPVSHAFHTRIVSHASEPLGHVLQRLDVRPPRIPVVANVTGELYPMDAGARPQVLEILSRQVAAPVQFAKGLRTLHERGVRVFVEVGPKKALHGFVEDVFADDPSVLALFSNHPKLADAVAFNQALCGLYASGLGASRAEARPAVEPTIGDPSPEADRPTPAPPPVAAPARPLPPAGSQGRSADTYAELGRLFADFLERGRQVYEGRPAASTAATEPVVITGAGLGLPGLPRVFDDSNVGRILRGESLIGAVPLRLRRAMAEKHVVRLVKSEEGESHFESIDHVADVIKLAARGGDLDLEREFGVAAERVPALDTVTRLAIGSGIDALRDAGIPLVMRYKTTTRGTQLPDRFMLPEDLRDDTGVVFASAFPGLDSLAEVVSSQRRDQARRERLDELRELRATADGALGAELDRRIREVEQALRDEPFVFDRRFLFRILAMGHSQFAEHIGARGPNTQVNAACASTTQAIGLAEDWIRAGRCRRVVVISADDATSDHLMEWIGAGFLASGAAATDEAAEEAALPFDRRRHGMIVGMGAAALVVESADAARERGVAPICDVLSAVTANSAFHGTRLDPAHIADVMEDLVSRAERQWGLRREAIAPETVFVSHETYTPARGGSASAEVHALRKVFGDAASLVVMANTKGFTGHPMGVGIEDVVAVKALETGLVPPIPNFKEVDPELGTLNLARGGSYPVRYALRLAAGFGSQISLALLRAVPSPDGRRRRPEELGFEYRIVDPGVHEAWLRRVSGYDTAPLEVVRRTLRVREQGAPACRPAADTRPASLTVPAAVPAAVMSPAVVASPAAPPVAAAMPPPPSAPVAAPAATALAADPIRERILALVTAKTGYPPDMLDLDLDLEADLGIDTVKQAELFAAVREEWGIPRDEKRRLRDYPTLQHVITFVHQMRPELPTAAPAAAPSAGGETSTQTAAPASPPTAAAPETGADPVAERILQLVTEKTGYPPDMLDLDLDLEADLGIDTVKQAELFASVRSVWDIPRDDKRKLRDYPTLRHVIAFVQQNRPDLRPAPAESAGRIAESSAPAAIPAEAPAIPPTAPADLAAADRVPRRTVVPVVRPPLALCKPTRVVLGEARRVVVMPDRGGVGEALAQRLGTRGVEVLLLEEAPETAALESALAAWLSAGPIHGVYWLPALDAEGDLATLSLDEWREGLRRRVKLLYATMRALDGQVQGPETFLVSATRLGGHHGYDPAGSVAPMGGAVCGFTKAFKRERPEVLVKVVDFERDRPTAEIADRLVDETLRDPGVVEVGYKESLRVSVSLREEPAADGRPGLALGRDTVFLVTGAAGAIVSAITADLAAATGGTFHLLDLVPEPDRSLPDLARLGTDREGLKRELFERQKARGERATPALVEKELLALERQAAALAAIKAVEHAGGTVYYYSLDLRDADAVETACRAVRDRSGRVDVLLHGAGLEVSRLLRDKEPHEFGLVFDVKADGWFNVLKGLADTPLAATVAFSSIAGRFGNAGQTDYSAANDLLAKTTSSFRTSRPATRGIVIDWTAWGDIGMATRGSIPHMMERAGIDMLPSAAGVPVVRRELGAGGTAGEIVIAGRLGLLGAEWDETGGLALEAVAAREPMIGTVAAHGLHEGLCVETLLDPARQAFLFDHRIEGTPVLPGVMGIESFAEAAALFLPGWHVSAVEDVRFLAPFKFYRDEPRPVQLRAVLRPEGAEVVAECRLVGNRAIPGQAEPQVTTHFTARVRLSRSAQPATAGDLVVEPPGKPVGHDDIYHVYFHGPSYQVLDRAWRTNGSAVGLMARPLPADHEPADRPLVMAPRLIELCFQTAGVFEIGTRGRMGLPLRVERVSTLRPPEAAGGARLFAVVTRSVEEGGYDARVVDERGDVYVEMHGYRTVELPSTLDAGSLRVFQTAMS